MKNKVLVIAFALILALVGGCQEKESEHETNRDSQSKSAETETFYTCPMHPQVRESEPGKCPICHMNLVKIQKVKRSETASSGESEDAKQWRCKDYPDVTSSKKDVCPIDGSPMIPAVPGDERPGKVIGEVILREAQLGHFRPAYFRVSPMKMQKDVRLLGTVLPSEEKESKITARVPGRVEKVYIESTGSFVKKGAPVVDIYSPQLITAGEEYLLARRNLRKNPNQSFRDLLRQSKERLKLWGIKERQMESWHRQNKVPRAITIYSSETGIVRKRNAVEGKYFKEGENFFELSELSSVWVEMDVYESDAALVDLGQEAKLSFTALPRMNISGVIDFISPVLDPESRTLKVRTTVKNPDGRIKPGMAAEAVLNIELQGTPLVVPRSAVIDTGKRKVVWIKQSENTFQAKKVETGFESRGYVEVLEGLKEGDEVVLEANFLLDAQAQLFGGYEEFKPGAEEPAQSGGHKH